MPSLKVSASFLCYFFVGVIVCVAVWLRCLGVGSLPVGQFTEHDAYLYQHQATLVSESGGLPARDARRWVPVGRDTTQSLNLYPIVLGYVHRLLRLLFPEVSVSAVVCAAPVFCFCIGLLGVCLFLGVTQGWGLSVCVGVLLATLPGTIERSAWGFGDRDAWCLMLGILAGTTYLAALQGSVSRGARLFWRVASGVLMFCGGLSWEGFGVFLACILCVEVYRFLTAETDDFGDVCFYLLWVCLFVPSLYLASPAYRSGEGWSTHLFSFMGVPPVLLLMLRLLRSWLCRGSPWAEACRHQLRWVSMALVVCGVLAAVSYVVSIRGSFAATTVVFGESRLMASIGELAAPHFGYWPYRYGSVFLTGSLGLGLLPVFRWGATGKRLSLGLCVFCVTTFFRSLLESVWGVSLTDGVFAVSLLWVGLALAHLCWQTSPEQRVAPVLATDIAFVGWGVFWLALAREAKRYDFFIGVALA